MQTSDASTGGNRSAPDASAPSRDSGANGATDARVDANGGEAPDSSAGTADAGQDAGARTHCDVGALPAGYYWLDTIYRITTSDGGNNVCSTRSTKIDDFVVVEVGSNLFKASFSVQGLLVARFAELSVESDGEAAFHLSGSCDGTPSCYPPGGSVSFAVNRATGYLTDLAFQVLVPGGTRDITLSAAGPTYCDADPVPSFHGTPPVPPPPPNIPCSTDSYPPVGCEFGRYESSSGCAGVASCPGTRYCLETATGFDNYCCN